MRKNSIFMTGMLALLLTLGLALAGCSTDGGGDDDDGGGGGGPVTVKITNNSENRVEFYIIAEYEDFVSSKTESIDAGVAETITPLYADWTSDKPTGLKLVAQFQLNDIGNSGLYKGSAPLEVTFDGTNFTPHSR
jgi:hypothetical protein